MRLAPPGRASVGEVSDPDDAPAPPDDPAPAELPHGWVRVGERRWWSTWVGATTAFAFLAAFQGVNFFFRIAETAFRWDLALLIGIGVTVGIVAVITLIRNALAPQPWVDLDSGQLRAGTRRPIPLTQVDRAVLTTAPVGNGGRVLVLRLTAKEARVEFILRDRKDATLDPTSTAVLAEALPAPPSPYRPRSTTRPGGSRGTTSPATSTATTPSPSSSTRPRPATRCPRPGDWCWCPGRGDRGPVTAAS